MEEIWKDIIIEKNGEVYDYTGLYEVSNYGRVRSLHYKGTRQIKVMKHGINNKGYQYINLYKDGKGKTFFVHRLVATMFIPNPNNLPIVNHKDENPSNNNVENLEWCTVKYNSNYGTCQERRSEKIKGENNPMYVRTGDKHPRAKKVICVETKQTFDCIRQAQDWLGKGNIKICLAGRSKTAGGYHWMYYEDYLAQQENVESF